MMILPARGDGEMGRWGEGATKRRRDEGTKRQDDLFGIMEQFLMGNQINH